MIRDSMFEREKLANSLATEMVGDGTGKFPDEALCELLSTVRDPDDPGDRLKVGAILDGYRRMDARVMRVLGKMDHDQAHRAYEDIYEEAVAPVVTLILAGMWDEAHALYAVAREEVEVRVLESEAREEGRAVG